MSLNSMPRPVQAMKWELDGSSSRATRNCQSCSEPLRWYDGPSRYKPDSCLMSPAGHRTACFTTNCNCSSCTFQCSIKKAFGSVRWGLTFDLFRHHAGIIIKMPRHFVKHTTWKTRFKKGAFNVIVSKNPKCTIPTFTRVIFVPSVLLVWAR